MMWLYIALFFLGVCIFQRWRMLDLQKQLLVTGMKELSKTFRLGALELENAEQRSQKRRLEKRVRDLTICLELTMKELQKSA